MGKRYKTFGMIGTPDDFDVAIAKLIATGADPAIGEDWRQIAAPVRRRRPGSKRKRGARIVRDHSINRAVRHRGSGSLPSALKT